MAYEFESRVRYSECDLKQTLTLPALVDYFQDCSTFQSESVGNGIKVMEEQQKIWMVLSWQIEILRMPSLGEYVTAQTWPYGFKMFYGYRNFALLDADRKYLAKANSVWVLMDALTGKPCRVPEEIEKRYGMEPALEMDYSSRKIHISELGEQMEAFLVGRHHLDTNHHVNNGQYIGMASEYLPDGFMPERVKVEYRKQAYLHDLIVPFVHRSEQGITVSLCGEDQKPYAVVVLEGKQA